ncbi:hypothetical protein [Micromonospora hortensis]|uniref:hypothetical protein n=1 Tax=Micromonospora hortensis TaxID=2911209 RepID=UPI001EE9651D|nr:hypothetical protein [Micromonospora hortensis]MCG5452670.1 hypothetical protein [Micromonospora hortensis]
MRDRLRQVAMVLLGAALFGTAGLSLGSWYAGRGTVPVNFDRVQSMAAELLPGTESVGSSVGLNYVHGALGPDDFGSAYAEYHYVDAIADECRHSELVRRNATALGWQGNHRVTGSPCDGWRAERDGLTATLTQVDRMAVLRFVPAAPDGYVTVILIATVPGAAAGAVLFGLAGRRRPPVPRLVGTLVTIVLLPGVVLTWQGLLANGLAEPTWPVWPALAPVLVPLALVLLLAGRIFYVGRRKPSQVSGPSTTQP